MLQSLKQRAQPIPSEVIRDQIIAPGIQTLAQMARRGQTHRAIRPDNMFLAENDGASVMFGDCVCSPPGWGQPAALEPIEMAMTPNWARGSGTVADAPSA